MATRLSPHFTLEELTTTSHREFDNTPTPDIVQNLKRLATGLLESLRAMFGAPIHISSGYRSLAVNTAVGGSKSSQHMRGEAADLLVLNDMTLKEVYEAIMDSDLPYDQLIFEYSKWIHISTPDVGKEPRGDALMIGSWTDGKYLDYDGDSIP